MCNECPIVNPPKSRAEQNRPCSSSTVEQVPISENTKIPARQVAVSRGLEDWSYVVDVKKRWTVLPNSIKVVEYLGHGDAFFGGSACDLPLGSNGRVLERPSDSSEVAVFSSIEDAYAAAIKIPNRRPGSILGVLPSWERPRERTLVELYPRLFKALRNQCLLTELEATCVLCRQEPEAVRHLGGWEKAVQAAWTSRHL
jgi:hypothetical protein